MAARHHDKTEAPTPKRKRDARKEGRAARSPDLVAWLSLLVMTMVLPGMIGHISVELRQMLARAVTMAARPDPARLPHEMAAAGRGLISTMAPVLLVAMGLAIVGNLAQVGFIFTGKPLKPKASHLNPLAGLKRMFSVKGLWQALTAAMKLGVIGAVVWVTVNSLSHELLGTPGRSARSAMTEIGSTALRLVQLIAAVCVLIGLADYAIKRRDHQRELRMTKHEVRQEMKDSEGDPHVRARMRSQRLAMSRNRMIGAVAEADVVITNPTHFAVAIAYEKAKGAPRVVARGADLTAARIREAARDAGVPCVESPPLARVLHRLCRPGEEIPAELYQAVATVLAFLHRLGESRRTTAIIGLPVVDTWTPSSGELERVNPAVAKRAARRVARSDQQAHSQRNGADRRSVRREGPNREVA